ncbi:MAG: Do family serine endopeptidase [Bacteroidota bacterium]|nr:Do family serine endopeptidase [Bacteroidota bacterium]
MKKIVSSIFLAFMGGVAALGAGYAYNSYQNSSEHQLANASKNSLVHFANYTGGQGAVNADFTMAAEKSLNSVVHITTQSEQTNLDYNPFAQMLGMPPETYSQQGSGSGVIISKDGYIVTNYHVVAGANKIEVTLNDKRTYEAVVIGTDPSTDVALVKIKEGDLPFLSYGNSDQVKVGEWVLAVGNPFNLESTVTAGIISAKGRNKIIDVRKNPVESFLQTDAVVNPGNSGGALVNTNGELIGINTAIVSNNGSYQGYSFAIPVNIVKKVVGDLVEFGTVQRAYIGVSIVDINAKFAKENNIKQLKGAYVANLVAGGSAEESGIKSGDVITAIEDMPVNSVSELHEQIARYRPGDKVKVNVIRNEKEVNVTVTLKSLENTTSLVKKAEVIKASVSKLGVALQEVDNNELAKLKITNGVKIADLTANSKLTGAGIKEGFIITSINKRKIGNVKEAQTAFNEVSGGVLIEGIYPNGTRAYYGFGL